MHTKKVPTITGTTTNGEEISIETLPSLRLPKPGPAAATYALPSTGPGPDIYPDLSIFYARPVPLRPALRSAAASCRALRVRECGSATHIRDHPPAGPGAHSLEPR